MLNELHAPIKGVREALVDIPGQDLRVDQVVKRRKTGLQEVHLREWHHIHGDFIEINVQISLEPHRASQVIHDVCYN